MSTTMHPPHCLGTIPRRAWSYSTITCYSMMISTTTMVVLMGWGGWQRRWISDDGLIVLRTVRNLLAGNGPVFNMGERVEANTSTIWTYLIYVGSLLAGSIQLEYIALGFSLGLTLIGIVFVMLGTLRLYAPWIHNRPVVILPAGIMIYIALPPARDFATSGLENGLSLAYLGLLWWMFTCWATRLRLPNPHSYRQIFLGFLSCVAGCSVLIRPEFALIGGGILVILLATTTTWQSVALIISTGGAIPIGYQIFRMGYYGLLVPATALAKDANGGKWGQGIVYLSNFIHPYALWFPLILLLGLAIIVWGFSLNTHQTSLSPALRPSRITFLQNPIVASGFFLLSGLIQILYWTRQGGDFMHGRVLLAPLFCLLAPIAIIPIRPIILPNMLSTSSTHLIFLLIFGSWLFLSGWSLWVSNSPGLGHDGTQVGYSGIVDERRFYAQATGHAHPLTAADYLDYPRMRAIMTTITATPQGALLLPAGNYDQWDVVPALLPPKPTPPHYHGPHTVFFTNLGMVGMNTDLSVRVIDQIGLANPIAAHTQRIHHGRIGHDKDLFREWAIADGPWVKWYPYIPPYLDQDWVTQAQVALQCPKTQALLNGIRRPLGIHRFISNFLHASRFTQYRIDRLPANAIRECGLPMPPPTHPTYTGMPPQVP